MRRLAAALLALLCLCTGAMAQGGKETTAATAASPAGSGENVYRRYCVTCHGANADGKGPAAKLYKPAPADLTTSTRSDQYKKLIIRSGGAAMGRSASMPPWGEELDEQQITNLVEYLRSLKLAGT